MGYVSNPAGESVSLGLYGDGSDGDHTLAGDETLDLVKMYDDLTIGAHTLTSNTNAYLILYVKGTLTIDSGGKVTMEGKGGAGGAGGGGGNPGAAGTAGTQGRFGDAGTGGAGGDPGAAGTGVGAGGGGGGWSGTAGSAGAGVYFRRHCFSY